MLDILQKKIIFSCNLKFLFTFAFMKFGTLYIWSWRSSKI